MCLTQQPTKFKREVAYIPETNFIQITLKDLD